MPEFSNLLGYDVKDATARASITALEEKTATDIETLQTNISNAINVVQQNHEADILELQESVSETNAEQGEIITLLNNYVTPQMFGAVGDGITDDSAAFQSAIDTGYHVLVPLAKNEMYLIQNTLTMANTNQSLFSDAGRVAVGRIICDCETLLNITAQGIRLTNIYFKSNAEKTNTCVKVTQTSDGASEIKISNCEFDWFNIAIDNEGRAPIIEHNIFAGNAICVNHNYNFDGENELQTLTTGDRRFIFKDNMIHNHCTAINVAGGALLGAMISGNVADISARLLISNGAVYNSIITNNAFTLLVDIPIQINGTFKNCVIANNTFKSRESTFPDYFIFVAYYEEYVFEDNVIANNTFDGSARDCLYLNRMVKRCTIIGNTFNAGLAETAQSDSPIQFWSMDSCTIVGNTFNQSTGYSAITGRAEATAIVSNTQILGNTSNLTTNILRRFTAGERANTIQGISYEEQFTALSDRITALESV